MNTMIVILIIYYIAMLGIGFWSNRFNKNMTDFLLAGRRLGLLLASFALAAAYFGGGFTIGIGQGAYIRGIVQWWHGISGGIGLILVGIMAKRMRDLALYTVPDFLDTRYKSTPIRAMATVLSLIALVGILAAQVSAVRNLLTVLGIDPIAGSVIAAIVFVVYTGIGGLWASTLTDFVQLIISVVGVVAAAIVGIMLSGGWSGTVELIYQTAPPPRYFHILGEGGFTFIIWLSLPLVLYTFIGQDVYQRMFASKDGKTARNACFIAGVAIIVFTFFSTLMGMVSRGMFPYLERPGEAVPMLIAHAFHPLLAGLVFAAIMAAIMSTASSILTAASSHIVNDIYLKLMKKEKEQQNDKKMLLLSRAWTLIIGAIAVVVSTMVPEIVAMLLWSYTLYVSGVFIPVVGGFFWKRATRAGATTALIAGSAIAFGRVGFGLTVPLFSPELFTVGVCVVIFVVVSLLTGEKKPENA